MGRATPRVNEKRDAIHPDAPAGGGGPGFFRDAADPSRTDTAAPFHPRAPVARYVLAKAGATASKTKPPPKTVPSTTAVKVETTSVADINVVVEVLGDGTDPTISGAKTSFDTSGVSWNTPGYTGHRRKDGVEVITKLSGPYELKGKITIQTVYGPAARPDQTSLYGRGTTAKDKKDGNTTLGFHEHCHRQDYLKYLKDNPLPVFTGKAGMTVANYNKAVTRFDNALKKYFADMAATSEKKTDEVGDTKSQCKRDGKCAP